MSKVSLRRSRLVVGEEELVGREIVGPPFLNFFGLKVMCLLVRSRQVTVGLHGARWKAVYSLMRV